MDRPPNVQQPREWKSQFSRGIDPAVPVRQKGFHVTIREWNRLKTSIRKISLWESLWIGAMSFFGAAAISFGTGAATLTQVENVALPVLLFFFSATFAGFCGAVVCLFGCLQSRSHRKSDIDSVIERMEDIEQIYFPLEQQR